MENATIQDLKNFLQEFEPSYYEKRGLILAYDLLTYVINWAEANQIKFLPLETPTDALTPLLWPEKIPPKPSQNYDQFILKYLNPISEVLYIVGKIDYQFTFTCIRGKRIRVRALKNEHLLKTWFDKLDKEKKDIVLKFLYREFPLSNNFFHEFQNDMKDAIRKRVNKEKVVISSPTNLNILIELTSILLDEFLEKAEPGEVATLSYILTKQYGDNFINVFDYLSHHKKKIKIKKSLSYLNKK